MVLVEKPYHFSDKLARVGLVILSLLFWWPLGLAILIYLLWSRKMRRHHSDHDLGALRQHRGFRKFFHTVGYRCGKEALARSSGNTAFDEYREQILRRLDEDRREFTEFLDRLRRARDQAEFDQFMAEQNHRRENSGSPSSG